MNSRVEHLLLSAIDSVEQCEILVASRKSPERWWTASELAQELGFAEWPTSRDLEVLAGRGFFDVRTVNDLLYRLAPASDDLAQAVDDLADAYRANRVDVLSFIVSRKGRSVRHFAEAFNFRREH